MTTLDAALLKSLRAANVHLPAGEFAEQLQTSTATIQERVMILREAGFEIDERPGLGFRLVSTPDRLIADDLHARLGTSSLVREIIVLAETTSTNDRANDFARRGAPPSGWAGSQYQAEKGRPAPCARRATHSKLWR